MKVILAALFIAANVNGYTQMRASIIDRALELAPIGAETIAFPRLLNGSCRAVKFPGIKPNAGTAGARTFSTVAPPSHKVVPSLRMDRPGVLSHENSADSEQPWIR
jgi:hypothetical protein